MEDALAHVMSVCMASKAASLNPCCNGRCTRTLWVVLLKRNPTCVLILVVMEDALAQKEIIWVQTFF